MIGRPRNSRLPSAGQRARSPVRYIRARGSAPNGSGTKRSAVSSRPLAVAARHAVAADAELARDADRHRLAVRVEHVGSARSRSAGRSGCASRALAPRTRAERRHETSFRSARSALTSTARRIARRMRRQRARSSASPRQITSRSDAHWPKRGPSTSAASMRRHDPQHGRRRGAGSRRPASSADRCASGSAAPTRAPDDQRQNSICQIDDVEADRRGLQHAIVAAPARKRRCIARDVVHERAMLDHHALGRARSSPTCRSRRRDLPAATARPGLRRRLLRRPAAQSLSRHSARRRARQPRRAARRCVSSTVACVSASMNASRSAG